MDAPKRIWLDAGFQPWRVWTIEMSDLTEYTLTTEHDRLMAEKAAQYLADNGQLLDRIAELEAENARLRDALHSLTGVVVGYQQMPPETMHPMVREQVKRSYAALKGDTDETV